MPENSSDNTVEVTVTDYTINGETTIYSGDWQQVFGGGGPYGSGSTLNSSNNTFTFQSGTIADILRGGYTYSGNSIGNTIVINGGTIGTIYGGDSHSGNISDNIVEINGGTIGNILGGMSYDGLVSYGTLENNQVIINDGIITENIYGALTTYGTAKNNSVTIKGGTINGYIYGGYSLSGTSSGNALNIHTTGLTAKNIYNFEIIRFYLPSNVDTITPVLTLTESNTDISGAQVLAGVEGNANLNVGDTVTLMTNAGTITDTGTTYGKLTEGVSLTYDLTVKKDGDNKIIATIGSSPNNGTDDSNNNTDYTPSNPVFNPKIEILPIFPTPILPPPEIPEPSIDFEQDGLDSFFENEQKGWEIFANAGFGPMRYKVNNGHIDTTNQNVDLGFARNIGNTAGRMTIAPIIDYQNTNYDTYLNDGTHARGNSKYTGGGFVLRNLNRSGFYVEGSFRIGRNKTDFASEDLDTTGNFGTVTYNTAQTVWNAHLKLGKYIRLNKNNLLNVYGFYYHTHQGGSSADLSSGEHYNFSSANAGRLRLGYRMTTRTSKISQVYTGLAYQFEHNGGVTARYKDYSTGGENHKGSSGMLELGWIIKPLRDNPWTVDINATGWIGNQRGVKAFAKIQKAF